MPSVAARIVARVKAMLPFHWLGRAGARFRQTISEVAEYRDPVTVVGEGAKRLVVGRVNQEYAEAERNFADAENGKIDAEYKRRTLDARVRQEHAKADQEESRARTLQQEEILGRLKLFDELRRSNAILRPDARGNLHVVKAPPLFDWERYHSRFVRGEEVDRLLGGSEYEPDGDK